MRLGVYTFAHFCVDFSCFFMLFSWYSRGTHTDEIITVGFLTYNIIAFGLQPVIGYFCDRNKRIPIELIGSVLLIGGLLFMSAPALSIVLMGLGNACFHIGGGIDSIVNSGGKMARSGVFVSSGALGVAYGSLIGINGWLSVEFFVVILAFCIVMMYVFCKKQPEPNKLRKRFAVAKPGLHFSAVIISAAAAISIRSYAGSIIPAVSLTVSGLLPLTAIGSFLGKAAGGFIADRIGAKETALLSLSAAAALLTFGQMNPWIISLGVLFLNMTMPITLCAVASALHANPGLAFGTTTLALLCGNVPTFFTEPPTGVPTFVLLAACSMVCLQFILRSKGKRDENI